MYDPIEITRKLVFGTEKPDSFNYNLHIRSLEEPSATIDYNALEYMTVGGGRFAYPSLFSAIDKFFDPEIIIPEGDYNANQITDILNLSNKDFRVTISQYGTAIGFEDHPERSYIFGTTPFELDISEATFRVSDIFKIVENIEVTPRTDDFDFRGGNTLANFVNNFALIPTFDPYNLSRSEDRGRGVTINYLGSGREYATYSPSDYARDNFNELIVSDTSKRIERALKDATGIAALSITGGIPYFLNIASDEFLSYSKDERRVIYGTPDSDRLDVFDSEILIDFIGEGINSLITPSFFAGGTGNDTLIGGLSDDEFQGGEGNDRLNGGGDEDIAVFFDEFVNYDYSITQNGRVTFAHTRGTQIDGTDTLRNIEFARFINTDNGTSQLVSLPLEDGENDTVSLQVTDTTPNPNINDPGVAPYLSTTLPINMLDGDVEYTVSLSPVKPDTQYNIAFIIDASPSVNATELQQIKDAYISLTNDLIAAGVADDSNMKSKKECYK